MNPKNSKEMIALRAARELELYSIVNLGIGIPTMVANYLDEKSIFFIQKMGCSALLPWKKWMLIHR